MKCNAKENVKCCHKRQGCLVCLTNFRRFDKPWKLKLLDGCKAGNMGIRIDELKDLKNKAKVFFTLSNMVDDYDKDSQKYMYHWTRAISQHEGQGMNMRLERIIVQYRYLKLLD